jgi:hypothetical protein
MPLIKIDHIPGKKPARACGKRLATGPNKNMEVVGHERPGIYDQVFFPAEIC